MTSDRAPIECVDPNCQYESLQNIRTGVFVRTLALAKIAYGAQRDILSWQAFREAEDSLDLQKKITLQTKEIARELGALKGSVMKVGQLLSVFGEYFFPPQVNEVLKLLQSNSSPLDWGCIEPILKREITAGLLELNVEKKAFAAASIGQVHRAVIRHQQQNIALKVQYPKVENAIHNDLRALKTLLLFAPRNLKGDRTDLLLKEAEDMLVRETDYNLEAKNYTSMRKRLEADDRFIVPKVHYAYSTKRVLALDFVEGYRIDSPQVQNLSQDRRNKLGQALLELYLLELFCYGNIQTDAHIGNYLIQISTNTHLTHDKIVLLDFGAVRTFMPEFLRDYAELLNASLEKNVTKVIEKGTQLGFLKNCDPPLVHDEFYKFCELVIEPFQHDANYRWHGNNLPERLASQLKRIIEAREFRPPPRESLFLDRKSTGLYFLLALLRAETNSYAAVQKALKFRLAQGSELPMDE